MDIFDLIRLLGGLSMFLYGMRLMGDGLKESASGPLKKALETLTSTTLRAFLLGFVITAVIQSSKATIVITAGLVGTGILSFRKSAGIILGANIGTTVTGQIIGLMDLSGSGMAFLQFFNPSTLGPLALTIGMVMTMVAKSKERAKTDEILIGFGILFSGLITMTDSVSSLTEGGLIEELFVHLNGNYLLAFALGAGVAFVLQSASASVGVIQAFSITGLLSFAVIAPMLLGIYLGECITTFIVCSVGANVHARRVGMINVVYNIGKILLMILLLVIGHQTGLLASVWDEALSSASVANANTLFNIISAVVLFPALGIMERLTERIVPAEKKKTEKVDELLDALNPAFFQTPALAFGRCYDALLEMYRIDLQSIYLSLDLLETYDQKKADKIHANEERIDLMADRVTDYLVSFSSHISTPNHLEIFNHYYSVVTDLERLGDHANNIADIAHSMEETDTHFSRIALEELAILRDILDSILDYGYKAFEKRDMESALHIEPLEQVVDDVVVTLKGNYLKRLSAGECSIFAGTEFLNVLSEVERLGDITSNIGVATISRVRPEIKHQIHEYIQELHSGKSEPYNEEYAQAHSHFFSRLEALESGSVPAKN